MVSTEEGKQKQAWELSPGGGSEMTAVVQTPSEDLDEPAARWRRDTKLISEIIQLEHNLRRELTKSDVYQKFGSRIDAISDLLPFLVKWDEDAN